MSNFTPLVPFATDFDGDHVTMNLRRLKRGALLKLTPHLPTEDDISEDGKIIMSFKDQAQFTEVAVEILPAHVVEFAGLKTAEGVAISLEEAVEEAYFMPLLSRIMGKLLEISKVSEVEAKNSAPELADTSKPASSDVTHLSAATESQTG